MFADSSRWPALQWLRRVMPHVSHSFNKEWQVLRQKILSGTGSQLGAILPSRGTFGNVRRYLVVTDSGGRAVYWHLMGRGQGRCSTPCNAQGSPHCSILVQMLGKLALSVTQMAGVPFPSVVTSRSGTEGSPL